jgi:acyl carrier protein
VVSTPTAQEIEDKVIAIVCEHLAKEKSEVSRETSYVNDLNADSLDIVEVVMDLEEEFDMSVPDEDAQKIDTIGATVDYIQAQLSKNAEGASASGD